MKGAVSFRRKGRNHSEVVDAGKLVIFTTGGERRGKPVVFTPYM
jgi:hypothetical protein